MNTKKFETIYFTAALLVVGIALVIMIASAVSSSKNQHPRENELLFTDDSRSARLYYLINEDRAKHELPILHFDIDIAEEGLNDARRFEFTEDEVIYVMFNENSPETIFEVWKQSSYYERFILNEEFSRIGVCTYYEEKTKCLLFVAKFGK